jgi:hypothetical protein
MSQNRIRALHFDPKSFPMPPSVEEYSAIEHVTHIVFFPQSPRAAVAEDYISEFSPDESGCALGLADDDYVLYIRRGEGDDLYRASFTFLDTAGRDHKTVSLDLGSYMMSFQSAFKLASMRENFNSAEDVMAFEIRFSVTYLKNKLSEHIEGNDAFWLKFHRELDVATAPVNLQFNRELDDLPAKPVIYCDSLETAIATPRLP